MAQRIRIINKTKKGCTLDFKGELGIKEVSWEEFNKIYLVKDNVWAEMNPEWEKKTEELDKKVNDLVAVCLMANSPADKADPKKELVHTAMIGQLTEELTKELSCSPADLMKIVQKRISIVKNPIPQKKQWKKKQSSRPVSVSTSKPATFGDLDALKELKARMEAEKK